MYFQFYNLQIKVDLRGKEYCFKYTLSYSVIDMNLKLKNRKALLLHQEYNIPWSRQDNVPPNAEIID